MPSKPDIKDIIGNIFISPLTDIIYEYVKCQYCNYILQKLSSALNKRDKIEAKTHSTGNITIRVQKSLTRNKYNLYALYDNGQEFCKEDVDASLGQITYFLTHVSMFRIYNADIDRINVNHTDTPADVNWTKDILFRSIGIDTDILYAMRIYK